MSARDELARVLCKGQDGAWFCQNFDADVPGGCSRCTRLADAVIREWLPTLAEDEAAVEVARKAIEDELIDWRDERRFMVCGNGFTVCEKDGSPSEVIRFRTDIGFRIGFRALAAALRGDA